MTEEITSTTGKPLFLAGAMVARSDGQYQFIYSEDANNVPLAADLYHCYDAAGYPVKFNYYHWRFKPKGLTGL